MRKFARIDDNQREVVEALRKCRCLVQSLATIGNGCPDLLVFSPFTRRLHLLEVKDGRKRPKLRELTPDEKAFKALWGDAVVVVLNVADALVAVGAYAPASQTPAA